ncbi:Formyltransferase [Biscogniauxia mediterranea]|nr:Formyltransferase [Biscogniauxia mediterranea]
MGTRAVIPGLRVFPLRAGARGPPPAAPWRSPSHGQRAFRRTRDLRAVPTPFATTSPLSCSSCLRGFSTTTARALHREDPPAGGAPPLPVAAGQGGESGGVRKKSEPLNILFCGSDGFSCAMLERLHAEHLHNRELIRSIEVVVRPGKRIGRGLKMTHDPPVRSLAEHLGLPIHIRDTFTGWDMPSSTNLIVAVSFGLRVPERLLRASRYGGLNVHPSLLPDLRGPAPLHHALLRRRALAGVTLQTLHPALFDHGVVLAQTPADPADPACIRVPRGPAAAAATPRQLLVRLLQPAGDMLVGALRAGLHVPPLVDAGWEARLVGADGGKEQLARARLRVLRGIGGDVGLQADGETCSLVHAPKITTADRQVRLSTLFAPAPAPASQKEPDTETETETEIESDLSLRQRVIGPLWFYAVDRRDNQRKRIIIVTSSDPSSSSSSSSSTSGDPPNPLSKTLPPAPEPPPSSRVPQILSSVPPSSSSSSSSSPRAPPASRIIIRFLDDPDPSPSANPNSSAGEEEEEEDDSRQKAVYLSLAAGPAPPGGKREDEHGCVYFGRDFRVEQLKVEGSKTRPARQALRNFVVGEVGPDGEVRVT